MSEDTTTNFTPPRWRAWVILGLFAVFGISLVARAVDLQIYDEAFLTHQGDMRHIRTLEIPANRGAIVDRNDQIGSAPAHAPCRLIGDIAELFDRTQNAFAYQRLHIGAVVDHA